MSMVFNSFLSNSKFEDVYVSNSSDFNVVIIDVDPECDALIGILRRINVDVSVFKASAIIPKVRYYNNGNINVRNSLYHELSSLNVKSTIIMASTDVDSKLREVIDVANGIGLKTACLFFGQKQYGAFKYENAREGYRYGISDRLMFVDPAMYKEVHARNLGVARCKLVSDTIPSLEKTVIKKDMCLIEEVEKTKLNMILSFLSSNFEVIYVRKGFLNKDEVKKYNDLVSVVEEGIGYREVYNTSSAIFTSNDEGFCCKILGVFYRYGNISDLKSNFLYFDESLEYVENYFLNKEKFNSVLMELLDSEKIAYKTLALSVKKGSNLFDALRYYPRLLGCENHIIYRGEEVEADTFAVFGLPEEKAWKKISENSKKCSSDLYNLENGFLGFTGIALLDAAVSYSIIKDTRSIYFNGLTGSSVEDKIFSSESISASEISGIRRKIERITKNYITKYNHSPIYVPILPGDNNHKVLIVDQRYADKSISYAGANENTFKKMLDDALVENPESDIIVKVHPDALTGLVSGHYHLSVEDIDRVYFYDENINSVSLLEAVDSVYVVSSQMGFEALMLGKPVNVYGISIYAGWGLTNDRVEIPRRAGKEVSLEQLFKAIYIDSSSYVDPSTGEFCDIDTYIDGMISSRKLVPNPSNIVNIGTGSIVYNEIINKYFIDKSGSITLNTLFTLMMLEKDKRKRVLISHDILPDFFDSEQSNLASQLYKALNNELDQKVFLLKLLPSFRLNDAFKVLVVYFDFWDKKNVSESAQILISKSSSEVYLNKVRSWLSNVSC